MKLGPEAGAVPMGTGIVSVALLLDGQVALSRLLLVLTIATWIIVASFTVPRLLRDGPALRCEARSPAALTAVAATAVLGTRLLGGGLHAIPILLLVVAALVWGVLSLGVRLPRTGAVFMITVATQSLAVLAALISGAERAPWLTVVAAVVCALGVALYALALSRFDLRQLVEGAGDHWVAGGALAISALASAEIGLAAAHSRGLHAVLAASHPISTALWIAAIAWLPVLVAAEVVSPRRRFEIRRWATVFPVGMYAACSFEVGRIHGLHAVRSFASVWTWVSLGVWLAVAASSLARLQKTC